MDFSSEISLRESHFQMSPFKTSSLTGHVRIANVKVDRAHFRVHFREHCPISHEHARGSLRGDPLVRFAQKASTFVGISVDIFMYTPVCIFVSTFLRQFVGQSSRFACSVLF